MQDLGNKHSHCCLTTAQAQINLMVIDQVIRWQGYELNATNVDCKKILKENVIFTALKLKYAEILFL